MTKCEICGIETTHRDTGTGYLCEDCAAEQDELNDSEVGMHIKVAKAVQKDPELGEAAYEFTMGIYFAKSIAAIKSVEEGFCDRVRFLFTKNRAIIIRKQENYKTDQEWEHG